MAITCLTEEHWQSLCSVMGHNHLVNDQSFATLSARLHNRRKLDENIGEWTIGLTAEAAEIALQGVGVPAAAVQDSKAVCQDKQLGSRGYLIEVEHPAGGKAVIEGPRFLLSRTPARIPAPAPTVGRDNQYVLQSILGYDEERITELVAAGALQ